MIPYHIRQAFKGMFRHLGMTLSAIVAVIITLLLLAIFLCAAGNVSLFASNIAGCRSTLPWIRISIRKRSWRKQAMS